MNRAILCIFAKPPVPGKVKTRLIPHLSAQQAALMAEAFLEDVACVCSKIKDTQTVIATVGYYLLGLTRLEPGLLDNLPWSQTHTRQATEQRLLSHGYTLAQTSMLFDIDTPQDLERLSGETCPEATRRALHLLNTHS